MTGLSDIVDELKRRLLLGEVYLQFVHHITQPIKHAIVDLLFVDFIMAFAQTTIPLIFFPSLCLSKPSNKRGSDNQYYIIQTISQYIYKNSNGLVIVD